MIANKLESTGRPGYLHISEKTLTQMFNHSYDILPGTEEAREDPYLRHNNIQTFLIAAVENDDSIDRLEMPITFRITKPSDIDNESKDRIKEELRKEFEQMPIGTLT